MPWIYLALIVVVLIVGLGVVLVSRYSAGRAPAETPAPRATPEQPPPQSATEPDVSPTPVAVIEEERPTFRSRMSKARNALAGTLLGIRARGGITEETWEDLEEALLRADVGVRVTDDLLGGLRTKVKAKEITEPDQLLEALQAEMV
ncbi:MAG TPA: signal recognition particle receptor subunit alpha, partial [Ilumatobacteraceae bacterium]|nr:signal recognition particle receptor subunit alpha [Ilumatobacteraceae bacterium]